MRVVRKSESQKDRKSESITLIVEIYYPNDLSDFLTFGLPDLSADRQAFCLSVFPT